MKEVTYIVSQDVERAVVRVRLLLEAVPYIVLCNEMARERMEAPSEEAGREEVYEGVDTKSLDEGVVKHKFGDEVGEVPLRECLGPHETRAERIKEYLERPTQKRDDVSNSFLRHKEVQTYAKKTFPRTLFRRMSSMLVGKSVSIPSSPRNLWCSMWYLYYIVILQ